MSSIPSIQATFTPAAASTSTAQQTAVRQENESAKSSAQQNAGVVYEKSSSEKVIAETRDGKVTEKKDTDRSTIIKQMQDDMNARKQQLLDIVRKSIGQQADTFSIAGSEDEDSVWKQFADGKVTVSEAARAQAQEDISEDGYWGVEKTSDRIVDFAKTLANNDPSKAEKLLDAFKTGYQQAARSWGRDLPDISSKTYDAVTEKFQKWMDEKDTQENSQTQAAQQTQAAVQQAETVA